MFKSYFVKEEKRYNVEDHFFHCYDPHVVLIKETAEDFTLSLYEKIFELTANNKEIDLDGLIEVCGVEIELKDVLEKFSGGFNYNMKELNVIDINDETPFIKISDGVKFFVSQKLYQADTEDEFNIMFSLVECESVEKFKEMYKSECEKSVKNDESVNFSGLFFDFEDAYNIKFIKKGKKIFEPIYPVIVELY